MHSKFLLFLVVLFFGVKSSISATAYIKLNLKDSSFCVTEIQRIFKETSFDSVRIVLPENAAIIKLKSLIAEPDKVKLIYRNSLVNYLNNSSATKSSSSFHIINSKGSIIYQSLLRDINYSAVRYFTQYDASPIYDAKIIGNALITDMQKQGRNVMLMNGARSPYVGSMNKKSFVSISVNEKLLVGMYKLLYGTSFKKKYPAMRNLLYAQKGRMPAAESAFVFGDTSVLVQYSVKDVIIRKNVEHIYQHEMLVCFNIDSLDQFSIYKMYSKDSLRKERIWARELVQINGALYQRYDVSKNNQRKKNHIMIDLHLNNKTRTVELGNKRLSSFVPGGYLERVSSLHHSMLSTTDHTIVYAFADSIYDFEIKKMIKIPFAHTNMTAYEQTEIWTGIKNPITKNYHVVFVVDNDVALHHLIFNKKGELILDKEVLDSNKKYSYTNVILHPYKLLLYNSRDKKIFPLDL